MLKSETLPNLSWIKNIGFLFYIVTNFIIFSWKTNNKLPVTKDLYLELSAALVDVLSTLSLDPSINGESSIFMSLPITGSSILLSLSKQMLLLFLLWCFVLVLPWDLDCIYHKLLTLFLSWHLLLYVSQRVFLQVVT